MSNNTELRAFGGERLYDFVRVGSFGRFKTGDSFPVDFVMVTLTPAEVNTRLTFARDIETAYLDFELLMQRDIDEDRVRNAVEPYLNRTGRSASERRGIVFFPPLLAAIVPVESEKMLEYYSEEKMTLTGEPPLIVREWRPFFKLQYFPSTAPDATIIGSGPDTYRVDRNQVEISIRIATGDEKGAKLVVIDGQHRLLALRRVYETAKSQLKELLVPICIVFPPSCTQKAAQENSPVIIQTVPQVFRSLFVDVNDTGERVGGHFNILLSDDTVPALAVRRFADVTLKEENKEGLAKIEWNIRARKNAEELNKPYSVASIGILNKALTTLLKNQPGRLAYVLNLAEVDTELHPEGEDEQEYPRKITLDSFSISQRRVIERQITKYLVPGLRRIYSDVEAHAEKVRVFREKLSKLKAAADDQTPGSDSAGEARKLLRYILDYKPIPDTAEDTLKTRSEFERSITSAKKLHCAPIIDYAIFQRAIIDVWGTLIDQSRHFELPLSRSVDVLVFLLNAALVQKGQMFDYRELYMQHSVFVANRIKPKEDTRRALARLIEAQLGNPSHAKSAAEILIVGSSITLSDVEDRLRELGIESASKFGRHFRAESMRTFERGYSVNMALDLDRRKDLEDAEQQYKKELAEYKAGQRRKDELSGKFKKMVSQEVAKEVELAMQALEARLGLDLDILVDNDESIEEDEQE